MKKNYLLLLILLFSLPTIAQYSPTSNILYVNKNSNGGGLVDARNLFASTTNHSFAISSYSNTHNFQMERVRNLLNTPTTTSFVTSSASFILDNDKIRIGNGLVPSINNNGIMNGPYYYNTNTSNWVQLTFQNGAFRNSFAINGDGTNEWNTNGDILNEPLLQNLIFDYSNYVNIGNNKGYGIITAKGNININGSPLEITYTYNLGENSPYIIVTCKIKNTGTTTVTNIRSWLGTSDDWIGITDQPTKTRGNINGANFVPITNSSERSRFIKIESNQEGAFFYTTHPKSNAYIGYCCNWFNNNITTNPTSSPISHSQDGSYAVYARLNDLAPNESDEFDVYYAAGLLVDINEIITDIANASGSINNITTTSATFNGVSTQDVTGYYILVPSGSVIPTTTNIINGQNYQGVNLISHGQSSILTNQSLPFSLTNLTPNTSYDLYYVTQKNDLGVVYNSSITALTFTTLENLNGTFINIDVLCNNESTGTSEINATGGLPPYTYQWSNGMSTQKIIQIPADTYSVIITDQNGENITLQTTINEPPALTFSSNQVNLLCNGDTNGTATVTVSGGTTPYSYLWNNGQTTATATNLSEGTYSVTVTDANNCSFYTSITLIVEDTTPPTAIAQNITVQLDASGNASITAAQINNGSTDNCSIDTMTLDVYNFNCSNIGTNTVTLTTTDSSGNTNTATATITVEDTTSPTAIAQNITVQLDASGNASITPAQIDNGSTDNCSVTLSLDTTSFSCGNIGNNTVTLIATDSSGNTDTATVTVTVEDNIAPTAIAQNITVQLDPSGNASITPAQIDNGSTDNCSVTLSLDTTSFNCANIGPNTVTLTATDPSGNTNTATATVTVEDTTPPTAIAQNITVQLNATGNASITAAQIDNGSVDNCAIASMTLDKTTFDCTNIGTNTVTLTATDLSGNTNTATATVTVEDIIPPTAIAQNITIQLDASGNASITPAQINNGSTDNCSVTLSLDTTSFSCANTGANTVTLTATDSSGNTDTATATVTVEDTLPPSITVNPTTLYLDASGIATLTVAAIDNGTTDNCGLRDILLSKVTFDCTNIGNNTVTVTANDNYGNTSSTNVIITVTDNLPPITITKNIEIALETNGTVLLTPGMINNNSTDNCGIDSMSLDITSLNCSNIGQNTVTLTVKDNAENQSSTTAIVTVLPIPEPIAISSSQTFCAIDNPIINDIEMASTHVVWYANATSTNSMSGNINLTTSTYYASTRYGNCESSRIPVNIIIEDPAVPTGNVLQYFCLEEPHTVAQLQANQQDVIWYDVSSGGAPLNLSKTLENQTYYATFFEKGCESSQRLAVEVIIRYCDVKIFNAVSANNDGKNDFLLIEGAETFPDNKLEIFNRWGSPVYEVTKYGQSGNLFRGIANTGLAAKGNGVLPFGTYFYVFSFTNHDGQRISKNGFIHLNN